MPSPLRISSSKALASRFAILAFAAIERAPPVPLRSVPSRKPEVSESSSERAWSCCSCA